MGWGAWFLDRISQRGVAIEPRYLLVRHPGPQALYASPLYSSHDLGGYYSPIIAKDGHSFSGGQIRPGEWTSTMSQMTLALTGHSDVRRQLIKGMIVEFKVGFAGIDPSDYETVFLGTIQGFSRSGGNWIVTIRSIESALISKDSKTDQDSKIFQTVPGSSVLNANYTDGVSTTISVSSSSTAQRESGGKYLLRVTPNSGGPFLITATGLSGNVFTGVPTTGAVLGGTDNPSGDANSGNAIEFLAYIEDHPMDVARKIITSTGAGTNGTWDTLIASWGLKLPASILDNQDIGRNKTFIQPSTGDTYWRIWADTPVQDALGWMNGWLNPGALSFIQRQGRLTIRTGMPPTALFYDTYVVTDDDIVEVATYDTMESGTLAQYNRLSVATDSSSSVTTEDIFAKPAVDQYDVSLPYIAENEAVWQSGMRLRMIPWLLRVPEACRLVLGGWSGAKIAPGALLDIRSRDLLSKTRRSDVYWYVVSAVTDWFNGTTEVIAMHSPNQDNQ